ncbi:MAG: UvrD-helicase domain-containing protein [Firmicutes bacterium]|nr:UvrD-helicase domain-containing protein [Bacillota bacterium]MDY3658974.1 UvrD-helicase domain-containing protein [Eubacteriales bacterium]
MDILEDLNSEQQKALLQTEGAVLVVAGAGSGKTRLLTHRIAYLIKEKHVSSYNILAITFTNKASREMKQRCDQIIGEEGNVWISTFHSMCARILRMDIEELGDYTKNFTIYSDQDSDKVFKNIFSTLKIDKDETKKSVMFHISNLKNNNMTIQEYENLYSYVSNFDYIKKAYFMYESELKKANALDFNDLLNKTYELLKKCPNVLEKYQERFKYILVDEFQDTNKIQYDLVKLLAGKYKNIFVVGDEDQCIYTWRGANYTNIFDFQKDFENVKVFKLEQNYRSTKNILNLANALIKKNKSRIDKNLWTEKTEGKKPEVRLVYDEREEAEIVAREIVDLVQNEGYSYSDFAVLVRLNALTFPFEEKFLTYNISHRIFGGFKFYERAEIKNLISYLRLFLNPRDDISFLRIINFPKRGIGDSAIKTLTTVANENETSLMNVVLQSEKFDLGGLAKKIENFKKIYVSLLASYEDLTLSNFVENVIKQFDIKSAYSSGSEEDLERQLNINTFVSAVQEFEKNNPSGTLLDFLESVTLVSDIDTMDDSNNAVTIATIHSVKGLEFRYVFIVGLEEKIFPISRAYGKDEDMEEERRLMYVAITRAKENLMLTRCRTRFLYGRREFEIDSRFLKELGLSGQEKMSPQLSVDKLPKVYFSEAINVAEKPETKYSYNPFAQKTKYEEYIEKSEKKEKNYVAGQTVSHPKFGTGKVLKCDDMFVDIEFEKLGIKTLVKEIAPLEIVE